MPKRAHLNDLSSGGLAAAGRNAYGGGNDKGTKSSKCVRSIASSHSFKRSVELFDRSFQTCYSLLTCGWSCRNQSECVCCHHDDMKQQKEQQQSQGHHQQRDHCCIRQRHRRLTSLFKDRNLLFSLFVTCFFLGPCSVQHAISAVSAFTSHAGSHRHISSRVNRGCKEQLKSIAIISKHCTATSASTRAGASSRGTFTKLFPMGQRSFYYLRMTSNYNNNNRGAPGDANDDSQSKRDRDRERRGRNGNGNGHGFGNNFGGGNRRKKGQSFNRQQRRKHLSASAYNNTGSVDTLSPSTLTSSSDWLELELQKRVTQLEHLVAKQTVEIRHLKKQCKDLTEATVAFSNIIELLREAGLKPDSVTPKSEESNTKSTETETDTEDDTNDDNTVIEYFDDAQIFGSAPSSVTDAADAAGASILAAMLGGKRRMLVDVRDAELTKDIETLVQFIELAILPVAAGLEGLKSNRNRVKIVFPTVSQLLDYRRTMALAAPEVVALSTLAFEPVEDRDSLVVILAPSPDNEEGLKEMDQLLSSQITQPVVVINHHMLPITGLAKDYDVVYHLRLLSVSYMSGTNSPDFKQLEQDEAEEIADDVGKSHNTTMEKDLLNENKYNESEANDDELEAAMKHAQQRGTNQGITRAMVIRAYPKPWNVFVDTSPDTDTDFVIAGSFNEEPTQDEVNLAIIECLEGSEREDELVARHMQEALEAGQSGMLKFDEVDLDGGEDQNALGDDHEDKEDNEDDDDDDDYDYDMYTEDSV